MRLDEYDIESLEAVKLLLDKDLGRRHTINDLVQTAGMSPTKLKESFKAYYGINIFAYVKAQRMNLAYELVCHSRYPFKKIAQLTGYKFVSHFNTAFKGRFLVTASRMRKGV